MCHGFCPVATSTVSPFTQAAARTVTDRWGPPERRDQREAGTINQIPDDDYQAAPRKGGRRIHLRGDKKRCRPKIITAIEF